MGITTPITNADITNVQSRFENLKTVWTIYDRIKTTKTTRIWAASIPNANSNNGTILEVASPPRIDLK